MFKVEEGKKSKKEKGKEKESPKEKVYLPEQSETIKITLPIEPEKRSLWSKFFPHFSFKKILGLHKKERAPQGPKIENPQLVKPQELSIEDALKYLEAIKNHIANRPWYVRGMGKDYPANGIDQTMVGKTYPTHVYYFLDQIVDIQFDDQNIEPRKKINDSYIREKKVKIENCFTMKQEMSQLPDHFSIFSFFARSSKTTSFYQILKKTPNKFLLDEENSRKWLEHIKKRVCEYKKDVVTYDVTGRSNYISTFDVKFKGSTIYYHSSKSGGGKTITKVPGTAAKIWELYVPARDQKISYQEAAQKAYDLLVKETQSQPWCRPDSTHQLYLGWKEKYERTVLKPLETPLIRDNEEEDSGEKENEGRGNKGNSFSSYSY